MTSITSEQLLNQFSWRYATKVFDKNKTIPADTWDAIEESLRLTPSSFGLQPWHFLVITNNELREKLLPHSWNQKQVTDCSHFVVLCTRTDIDVNFIDQFIADLAKDRGVDPSEIQGYRDVVVDFVSKMPAVERLTWGSRQTYLALQRLMDAAALLGVDTCPMEGFQSPLYDEILGLQEKNLTSTVCCALGYRSPEDKYATLPKSRFEKSQIITTLT